MPEEEEGKAKQEEARRRIRTGVRLRHDSKLILRIALQAVDNSAVARPLVGQHVVGSAVLWRLQVFQRKAEVPAVMQVGCDPRNGHRGGSQRTQNQGRDCIRLECVCRRRGATVEELEPGQL